MDWPSRIFLFVVRRLKPLAKIPLLPQLFDSFLLAGTFLFHRERIAVMEALESEALQLPGVTLRMHRFGGTEFYHEACGELGHIHGHGLLDVRLMKATAQTLIRQRKVQPHHIFGESRWVSFRLKAHSDVSFAAGLLKLAASN